MSYLNILRLLVDNLQFAELKSTILHDSDHLLDISTRPLLALAQVHLGEIVQGRASYEQASTRLTELDADARTDLAGVACVLQEYDEAVTLLQPVLAANPEHPLALARLAWCRMQNEQFDEALTLYNRSINLDGRRLPVRLALIRLFLQKSDLFAAQQALQSAIDCLQLREKELPIASIALFSAQLRELQLQIWVASEQLACAEQWLSDRRESLSEDEWVVLVIAYTGLLAGLEHHAAADELLRDALKYYPENLSIMLQLAELAQVQGRFMTAIRLLRKALAQDKENSVLWVQLSSACLQRFDKQARQAAEKAVELTSTLEESDALPAQAVKRQQAMAQNALAQVESQEQNFARAEHLYRAVLTDHPHFLPALQGLGQQQMQLGNIDEALALFERVKQIDPIKGHSALINARRFPEDEQTLLQMEKAAQMPSLEGAISAGILFQLASAWEKRKVYDKAFAFANQANAASKKFLSYDDKAHRNQCARLRHAFCKGLFEHRQACGVESSLPVYVLGMPRSGTTLVEQILAGHSKIFGAGELGVIPSRIQGLNRWERHVGSGRCYPDCIDDLTPYVTRGIANGVLDELRELAAEDKPEALHVVDKLPHNFENIGFIKFLFPKAKIISVRRDPRDIAISNYFTDYQAKHGGMGFAYDLTDIGQQLADHNLLMHHWHQLFPGEILEINYEDVVDDLEGSARRMLDYIGVEWQPQVLSFNELDRTVKTASVWQVRQPIYKSSKAKWKRYEKHLAPLIKGTNAKIMVDPINDMLTLPLPGFLTDGVALYKEGDLDGAELSFKKMLHHNPEHAACHYMLGLVYLSKHHLDDGIMQLEKALAKAPWHKEWRDNLIKAYQLAGEDEKAEELKTGPAAHAQTDNDDFDFPDSLQAIAD